MDSKQQSVTSFYDQLSNRYTDLIRRCVPRYEEIFYNLFHYIPNNLRPTQILDLGCGTGNLTAAALSHFPDAQIHALDISGEILAECRNRFNESFDLIISSIAIHHIPDPEKAKLYKQLHQQLKPGGVFVFADQTRGATEEVYQKHIARWHDEAFNLGSTQADWDMWMQHQDAHDHHTPVLWHLHELNKVGFTDVDVIWKNIMWAVIQGVK
jgi:tRNA (cmo5U34)-methyltransferase